MAETRKTLIKAGISLIISICVISACVLSVFGYAPKEKKLTGDYSLPRDVISDNEGISQDRHQRKFGVYTHTRNLNGEKIATVYSTSQVNDINRQRTEGEWFYLTDAEVLYLVSDTISLFAKYDKVCVVDINGGVHIYSTKPFNKGEICEAIALRLEVLCSAFRREGNGAGAEYFLMNECTGNITEPFLHEKYMLVRSFYLDRYSVSSGQYNILQRELLRTHGSAFIINSDGVFYVNELSNANENEIVGVF